MPQQHTHQTISVNPLTPLQQVFTPFVKLFGWYGIAFVVMLGIFAISGSVGGGRRGKKGQIAFGRQVGTREITNAEKIAREQLKKRKHNEVTLYIGTPRTPGKFRDLLGRPRTIVVPNAQEAVVVCGAPGKGKTFGVIDRLACSAFDQGFPSVIFDFKGEQIRRLLPYAADLGYECYVFAPGLPYSGRINPLEFLRSPSDVSMGEQLAVTLNRNASPRQRDSSNPYFTDAADALLQSLILTAKGTMFSDLLMAASFIQISDLARRMQVAQREGWTGLYAGYLSTALTSVANAPPTSGGVIGTAFNSFKRLVNPDFIMTLCGKSTIPLELKGKRVIFFQLDKRTQDAIAPVLATVLDLILSYNLSYRRDEPLVFVADEFPTLYLPNLFKLMAAERENGFVPIIGYQFNPQVENRYGRENTRIAIGACATKFIFNPQEAETAKMFAEYFGDEDVFIQSFSRNMGRNPSNSSSDQIHRRSVFSMRDILALPRGHCIYVNNAYSGRGYQGFEESGLPWRLNIQVPKDDIRAKERSEQLWDSKVRDRLIQRAQRHQTSLDDKVLAEELNARVKIADLMFPPLMGNDAQLLEQIANG